MRTKIFEICDNALANNQPVPTLRAVRIALGGGSYTTIGSYLREWKLMHPHAPSRIVKTAFTPQESQNILSAIWEQISPVIDTQVKHLYAQTEKALHDERANVAMQRAEMQLDLAELDKRVKYIDEEKAKATEEVNHLREDNAKLQAILVEKENNIKALEAQLREANMRNDLLQQNLATQIELTNSLKTLRDSVKTTQS